MPKTKKQTTSDSSDSDSGPDDRNPAKKAKPTAKATAKAPSKPSGDEDELSWSLGKNRFVKLTEFKGKWYVNIREYYMADNGDLRPGKKGIMLTMEQYQKFRDIFPDLEDAVKKHV